jgi:pimeloyl-ACP methyl ester carboxylesterase
MTDQAISAPAASGAMGRYLAAERRLWSAYGLAPSDRFVEIDRSGARLRIQEIGAGRPVLFVHGTIGPGGWAPLVARLAGSRSLVLDRPGWGLSDPVDIPRSGLRPFAADLLRRLLDQLELDRVDIVGGSIGDTWALSLAQQYPDRVRRVALLGGGPLVDAVRVPPSIAVINSPIGAIVVRLRLGRARLETMLRESGHGTSLAAGRISDALLDWRLAAHNDTPAMRHERALVRRAVKGRGWQPGLTFRAADLRAIEAPVLLVYGTADPTGDEATWRTFTAQLPNGALRLIDGAGHMPWFDEPGAAAAAVRAFLGR